MAPELSNNFAIADGPSRWDLILSLFDPIPEGVVRTIVFTGANRKLFIEAIVSGVDRMEIEKWKISGFFIASEKICEKFPDLTDRGDFIPFDASIYYEATYDTKKRKGVIKF
ncbi:MAG: hypothetical protein HY764_00885 [Candidatus Portnoybacteria bacterium]|nr:hypothetical protein [Candidatus Portnoybacteria bacterium]